MFIVQAEHPALFGFLTLPVESSFASAYAASLNQKYMFLPYVAVILYIVGIQLGERYMKNRKPFRLHFSLAVWNGFLTLFSFIGVLRVLPFLAYVWYQKGISSLICENPRNSFGKGPVTMWIYLFVWSKFIELGDTAFLVLKKRPVSFLHWFHHATVLMYCWYAGAFETTTGVWFAIINYSVHTCMYFYYFLAAVTRKAPSWGRAITTLQIAQMIAGICLSFRQWYMTTIDSTCVNPGGRGMLYGTLAMYLSYFALFLHFFIKRYLSPSLSGVRAEKQD